MITAQGLGSGLDISGLVTQLVSAERAGSDLQLSRQQSRYNSKFSALGTLKSAVSSFDSALSKVNDLSQYTKNTAKTSNSAIVTTTADTEAVPGTYQFYTDQLASSHSLASPAVVDSDETALGTGSITIRFGTTDYDSGTDTYNGFSLNADKSAATISIDSTNNTLEGIMGAINTADIGVSASIVNDGSGFRLLLSSDDTGLANSLEIAVDDDDLNDTDASGLSLFAFNASATNMDQTAAATDAEFRINGLPVSNSTNVVTSAIPGVTLTLKSESTDPATITIAQDVNAITSAIDSFLGGYNTFIKTANSLSAYDADKDIPSALLGDFTLRSIESQISNILRGAVEGFSGDINSLAELGISTATDGTLSIDKPKFEEMWEEYPNDVISLFAALGAPTDADVTFDSSTSTTVTGNYAVNITTLASYGYHTGASVLPDFAGIGTLDINSDNDNLTLEIDGITLEEITLTAGTYTTGHDLAEELQVQINGTTAMRDANKTIAVTYDSGTDSFTITSGVIGSTSAVNVLAVDTNSAAELGFSVANGVDGLDVVGTIDGVAANGAGDLLIAESGTDAEGLALRIGGNTTGSRGDVNFTRGISSQLEQLFVDLLDEEGALTERIESYESRLEEVADRKAEMELRWEKVKDRYTRQFNALDTLMSQMQSTSSYLEGQLAALPKPNSINNS